ncbi:MAG TPA: ABC transporter ATP-binding protein [Longimicrobiales bacterium]|nr:ABC transporter ATP-binding protein [Longimicrobiales bacterium]
MSSAFELRGVTKQFTDIVALRDVTLAVPRQSIVGLIGRNGSGKTTLLRHVAGFLLPDRGECMTLGTPSAQLGRAELSRMGVADQHASLIPWMYPDQLLAYVSSFYERWDRELERTLVRELEVNTNVAIGTLSPGNVQRLSLVVAVCHHPELLLLDEPLSDLDPIARQTVLALLLERFSSEDMTIVISSHMLRDIEPVVNRIVCMEAGRVVADDELDVLSERYAEWVVTSPAGRLPASFTEPYVLSAQGDAYRSRVLVRDAAAHAGAFAALYDATIEVRPLNLEKLFPLLAGSGARGAKAGAVHVLDAARST